MLGGCGHQNDHKGDEGVHMHGYRVSFDGSGTLDNHHYTRDDCHVLRVMFSGWWRQKVPFGPDHFLPLWVKPVLVVIQQLLWIDCQ